MRDISTMDRRRFLKLSGGVMISAASASGVATLMAPDRAWAMNLETFDAHQADTLLNVTRQIFPHDSLADMYYATVVKDLDIAAAADPGTATVLSEGITALDSAMHLAWVDLSEGNRQATLEAVQDSAFFKTVQGKAVVSLYNNELAWRHFGYEGPAFDKGGYLARGFNDLRWLPEPPEDASPGVTG